MIRVILDNRTDLKNALKKFRKLVEREGIVKECRKHEYYETRLQKRRKQRNRAIRMLQKQLLEEKQAEKNKTKN